MSVRSTVTAFASCLAATALTLPLPASAASKPTAQSVHCADQAKREGLTGAQRTAFVKTCLKGTGHPTTPTGPTATSKEAQAITKPSGVDRTTRSKQCSAEADKRGLAAKDRNAFRLSCLATAGPVSEGETGTTQPHPGHSINGIGVNNNKPSATTAKSAPATDAPGMAKPKT